MRAVVLTSGGLDSSVLALMLKREGVDLSPLHIDYGQIAETHEWRSCQAVCQHLGVSPPRRIRLPELSDLPTNPLPVNRPPNPVFYPTRNLLFLTLGAAYAYAARIDAVAIGLISNAVFPDQTKSFVDAAERAIGESLGERMRVLVPLMALDKRDIIRLARAYGLPPEMTYSCYLGSAEPCGTCAACVERDEAERALEREGQLPSPDRTYTPGSGGSDREEGENG